MSINKNPFTSYTLDEDKKSPLDQGKVFSLRLSGEEYQQLRKDMSMFDENKESTTIKLLAEIGRNVIHNTFGAKKMRWLCDPSRRNRLDDNAKELLK